jgi:MFS family permease
MTNPYEAPQADLAARRRFWWCTLIIILWSGSAFVAGFLLGILIHGMNRFGDALQQSPAWQVGLVAGGIAAVIAFPVGLARTRKLNQRLQEIHDRRQALLSEIEQLKQQRPPQ